MENIFQHILQMSIYGSIAIVVVLILRKCFHNLPKRVTCLFWLIPGLRLLCPLNLNSIFSVLNIANLSGDANKTINKVTAMLPAVTARPEPVQPGKVADVGSSAELKNIFTEPMTVAALVWVLGMIAILTYLTVKTVRMMKVLKTARISPDGKYYVSDIVDTSFVLGVIRPRIYMQTGLTQTEEAYILQHERMHIRNLDHITRIVGVLLVCVYWFDPFVWVAFVKMCADLEMRCDEAVIDRMGNKIKKEYCHSMVRHAMDRSNVNRGVYAAFAGDNYNGREIRMRIKNLTGYKKISKIAAVAVIVFALGLTIALSTKAQNNNNETKIIETEAAGEDIRISVEEHKEGAPVSTPGNLLTDMTPEENLENYGKEELTIPDDVVYSDEGRPYSKTYDYRDTPILKKLGDIFEKDGYEIEDPDMEYLDKEGNVQTGRELYTLSAYKEDSKGTMLLNVYMVSEEYARDSYNEYEVKDGIWYAGSDDWGTEEDWHVIRLYDPKTSVMIDASGNYEFDWEALDLFK